jgi:hypothetical protein
MSPSLVLISASHDHAVLTASASKQPFESARQWQHWPAQQHSEKNNAAAHRFCLAKSNMRSSTMHELGRAFKRTRSQASWAAAARAHISPGTHLSPQLAKAASSLACRGFRMSSQCRTRRSPRSQVTYGTTGSTGTWAAGWGLGYRCHPYRYERPWMGESGRSAWGCAVCCF